VTNGIETIFTTKASNSISKILLIIAFKKTKFIVYFLFYSINEINVILSITFAFNQVFLKSPFYKYWYNESKIHLLKYDAVNDISYMFAVDSIEYYDKIQSNSKSY
jgi:hypothetical protein